MQMRRNDVVGAAMLGAALIWGGVAAAQDPEVRSDEIIDRLQVQPGAGGTGEARTRGIDIREPETGDTPSAQATPDPTPAATRDDPPAGAPSVTVRIQFGFDSAELTSSARAQLDEFATALTSAELSGYRFLLEGHTDSSGSAEYNQALSERRARSARAYLISKGVPGARIVARGMGERQPADPSDPAAASNRRVVVTNIGR